MHSDVPLVTSETVIVMSEAIRCGSNITTRIISNDMLDFFFVFDQRVQSCYISQYVGMQSLVIFPVKYINPKLRDTHVYLVPYKP